MAALPTLRQLEYAVAVADHKSFHRAARACHVTQPGLSAQLRSSSSTLLDARLFERDRRNVWITAAGEEVVRARARGARRSARHGRGRARIRASAARHAARRRDSDDRRVSVPAVLPRVRRRIPELRLRLHEGRTSELVALLRRGELDLLVVALEAPLEGLETRALFEDRFVVAMSDRTSTREAQAPPRGRPRRRGRCCCSPKATVCASRRSRRVTPAVSTRSAIFAPPRSRRSSRW